jgi:hypothetical protein
METYKRKVTTINASSTKKYSKFAKKLIADISNRSLSIPLFDSFFTYTEADCIRAFSDSIPESSIRNMILESMVSCENVSAGSSLVFLHCLAGNKVEMFEGKRFTLDILKDSISKMTDSFTGDIVSDSMKISGRNGRVLLDSGDFRATEVVHGTQSCKWRPDQKFFSSLGLAKIELQKCAVVFIDGIVETISEFHKILNDSHEKQIPVAVFARGFGDDIFSTTALNINRQTAVVVPITIPFDEVGVNGMADMAGCFGSHVISSDKGELISNVKIENCVFADRMTFTPSMTEIEHSGSLVDSVVSKLSLRLSSADENQAALIRRRIEHIGSGVVTIKVGNDKKSSLGIVRDRIDFGLRFSKSCLKTGIVTVGNYKLPASSLKAGINSFNSFSKIIENSNTILEIDKDVE